MLDLLGGVLVILGTTGFGYLYMEKEKTRIELLEKITYLFKLLKSEITYKKQPLPYACRVCGKKVGGEEGRLLMEIAQKIERGEAECFGKVWAEQWKKYMKTCCLTKEEKKRVLDFSSFTGYEEEAMQENMMEYLCKEFTLQAGRVREELEKKKRVVLLASSCLGILFVLILL